MEWWLEAAAFVVLIVALILLFSQPGSWIPFIAAPLVAVVVQGIYQTFAEPLRQWVALGVLVLAVAAIAAQWRTLAAGPRGWRQMLFGRR